jgi:outer membrane biosynthesis protein TonB
MKGGEAVKKIWLLLTFAALACLLLAYSPVGETLGLITAESAKATNVIHLSENFDGPCRSAGPSGNPDNERRKAAAEESGEEDTNTPVEEPAQAPEAPEAEPATGQPEAPATGQPETPETGQPAEPAQEPATGPAETPDEEPGEDIANGPDAGPSAVEEVID